MGVGSIRVHIGGDESQGVLLEGAIPSGHKTRREFPVFARSLAGLVLEIEVPTEEGVPDRVE